MKTKNREIERPSLETLRSGHRVTPRQHHKYSKALDEKFGENRPRLKPGPKPDPANRYVPTFIKFHRQIITWAHVRAKLQHIGYQTVINQTLLDIIKNWPKMEGK